MTLKNFHQCYSDFCEISVSYFIDNLSVGIYNHYNSVGFWNSKWFWCFIIPAIPTKCIIYNSCIYKAKCTPQDWNSSVLHVLSLKTSKLLFNHCSSFFFFFFFASELFVGMSVCLRMNFGIATTGRQKGSKLRESQVGKNDLVTDAPSVWLVI